MSSQRIVIIGAGPTGLGAAYRLKELGYENWVIYEKENYIGGLSSSFKDSKGFTWDIGGHVMFSHNENFNKLADKLFQNDFIAHERESWIRMNGWWIPYPFQNNIRYLPEKLIRLCLEGMAIAQNDERRIAHFEDWIYTTFGEGMAKIFMIPYNTKMWKTPLKEMSYDWIAERISIVSMERIKQNIERRLDDIDWGPNNRFKFPLHGGTGGFFNKFAPFLKDRIHYNKKLATIEIDSKLVIFDDGDRGRYDLLINTSPLDVFVHMLSSKKSDITFLQEASEQLKHTGVYVVGIGIRKKIDVTKCWVYFPEEEIPFYRMTYFSRYSPNNVPGGDIEAYSSLMCETSFTHNKPVSETDIVRLTISGLVKSGILSENDKKSIINTWLKKVDYAYPVPTLRRDNGLKGIQPFLEKNQIYSRGRFGAWKYEIGNMDHSTIMGIEIINRILLNEKEKIWNL
jgi:protoporphyrinogen oxidase